MGKDDLLSPTRRGFTFEACRCSRQKQEERMGVRQVNGNKDAESSLINAGRI